MTCPSMSSRKRAATAVAIRLVTATDFGCSKKAAARRALSQWLDTLIEDSIAAYGGEVVKRRGATGLAIFNVPSLAMNWTRFVIERVAAARKHGWIPRAVNCRAGIARGVTRVPGSKKAVAGPAVNLALRLCRSAKPGKLVVGRHAVRAGDMRQV